MNSTDANDILFLVEGIDDLYKQLSRPFTQLSILIPNKDFLIETDRWISKVTLWEQGKAGLQITSQMYDLADSLEVGSLCFKMVRNRDEKESWYELSDSFSTNNLLQKIILLEAGKRIETGIIITTSNKDQILVVPNVMPYTLAIRCNEIASKWFEPEYGLDEYEIEDW